jgi:hypothetical protein
MSPIRAYPSLSDYKEPFVKVVVAFLAQVLRIETASILDISFEQTLPAYRPARKYFQQEYAVTVRLSQSPEHLGNIVYLGMKYDADEYSISERAFEPAWKLASTEQAAGAAPGQSPQQPTSGGQK